jgi:hypothetical protein
MTHAADAHRHGQVGEDGIIEPVYLSREREILGTIQVAVAMLLVCMTILQKEIGFGPSIEMQLDAFRKEFHRVFD